MADLRTADEMRRGYLPPQEASDRSSSSQWMENRGISTGWALFGLAAVALGIFAFYHFEPDFRRYMKIKRM